MSSETIGKPLWETIHERMSGDNELDFNVQIKRPSARDTLSRLSARLLARHRAPPNGDTEFSGNKLKRRPTRPRHGV